MGSFTTLRQKYSAIFSTVFPLFKEYFLKALGDNELLSYSLELVAQNLRRLHCGNNQFGETNDTSKSPEFFTLCAVQCKK